MSLKFFTQIGSLVIFWIFTGFVFQLEASQPTVFNHTPNTILDVSYSASGHYLAKVYASGKLEVVDNDVSSIIFEYQVNLPTSLLKAKLEWSSLDRDLLAAGIGGTIYILDINETQLIGTIPISPDILIGIESVGVVPEGIVSLNWDLTGAMLMAKTVSNRYIIWSLEGGVIATYQEDASDAVPVVWLNNGLISTGYSTIDIMNGTSEIRLGEQFSSIVGKCGPALSMSMDNARTIIIQGTFNGCLVLIDPETGDHIAAYQPDRNQRILDVDLSPDGMFIVAVGQDGVALVTEVMTGNTRTLGLTQGALYAVDWSTSNDITYGGSIRTDETLLRSFYSRQVGQALRQNPTNTPELVITPDTN
jgi:WD40 repeat protein